MLPNTASLHFGQTTAASHYPLDKNTVDRASQVYGPSNDAKAATQVIPANLLPDKVPYSGEKRTATADADSEQNVLNIDLAASSVTVFVMRKQ